MAEISAALVKELREETGLPLMDCKRALQETDGDKNEALRQLRESGKKVMAMRQDRSTDEGRIAVYTSLKPGVGAMVELQVESAPVTKNDEVIALANDLAMQLATGPGAKTPEDLWKQPAPSRKGVTLQEWKDELENKIREVFRLARIIRVDSPTGGYVHHDAKSGVLLVVEGGNDELAKNIAMHVAAMRPKATTTAELDRGASRQRTRHSQRAGPQRREAGKHHRENDRRPDAKLLC